MEITPLINNFSNYWPLDEAAIKAIQRIVRHQSLKRRACILQEGEECHHFTFVVEGCLRMYKVDDKGNVHNLQFAIENDWIADYSSFYDETPSELYIDALEPTQLFQIEKKDLFQLYDHFPVFDRNFRIIIENTFIEQQNRLLQTISSTAEDRYTYFQRKYPQLFNRISNVQIAAYIGVTPEFLSSIRKKIVSR